MLVLFSLRYFSEQNKADPCKSLLLEKTNTQSEPFSGLWETFLWGRPFITLTHPKSKKTTVFFLHLPFYTFFLSERSFFVSLLISQVLHTNLFRNHPLSFFTNSFSDKTTRNRSPRKKQKRFQSNVSEKNRLFGKNTKEHKVRSKKTKRNRSPGKRRSWKKGDQFPSFSFFDTKRHLEPLFF